MCPSRLLLLLARAYWRQAQEDEGKMRTRRRDRRQGMGLDPVPPWWFVACCTPGLAWIHLRLGCRRQL